MNKIQNTKDLPVWVLVKLPQIKNVDTGADLTVECLRKTIHEHHLGGKYAKVLPLTLVERAMIEQNPP